jgi:hypothetical protein
MATSPHATDRLTVGALIALAALHVAWGRGLAFPFRDRRELADAVIGRGEAPGPTACHAVATALIAGAVLVGNRPALPTGLRRTGLLVMSAVFAVRGTAGLIGRTDLLSPGSASMRFRRLDRRVYSPMCLALAAGALGALSPALPAAVLEPAR